MSEDLEAGELDEFVGEVVYLLDLSRGKIARLKGHQLVRLIGNPVDEHGLRYERALLRAVENVDYDYRRHFPQLVGTNRAYAVFAEAALSQISTGRKWFADNFAATRRVRYQDRLILPSTDLWFVCDRCRDRLSSFGYPTTKCACGNIAIDLSGQSVIIGDESLGRMVATGRQC